MVFMLILMDLVFILELVASSSATDFDLDLVSIDFHGFVMVSLFAVNELVRLNTEF